jgi:hypothetical protein
VNDQEIEKSAMCSKVGVGFQVRARGRRKKLYRKGLGKFFQTNPLLAKSNSIVMILLLLHFIHLKLFYFDWEFISIITWKSIWEAVSGIGGAGVA